jgi:hypothetical protein
MLANYQEKFQVSVALLKVPLIQCSKACKGDSDLLGKMVTYCGDSKQNKGSINHVAYTFIPPAGSHMTLMKVKTDVTGPWLSEIIYYIKEISKVSQTLTALKNIIPTTVIFQIPQGSPSRSPDTFRNPPVNDIIPPINAELI